MQKGVQDRMWGDATTEERVSQPEAPVIHQEGHAHAGRKRTDSCSGGSHEGMRSSDQMAIDGNYAWCVHVYLLSDIRSSFPKDLDNSIRVYTSGAVALVRRFYNFKIPLSILERPAGSLFS